MSPFFLRPIATPPMYTAPFWRMPYPMPAPAPLPTPAATNSLESFLTNANTLMTNAQKFTPYVQQLTPMVKNLPALWRMYKSFKQVPGDNINVKNSTSLSSNTSPNAFNRTETATTSKTQRTSSNVKQQPYSPRPSVPKIYQPTWP